jgi:hypothetical protein
MVRKGQHYWRTVKYACGFGISDCDLYLNFPRILVLLPAVNKRVYL